MDWPLFALISYSFLLILIVVLIILRSRRAVRSQYARLLEEKETKLARMQIDLEQSMEALDVYAEQLRSDWAKLEKSDKESLGRLYKKEMDLEAAFSALRARVTVIEIELKRQKQEQANYRRDDGFVFESAGQTVQPVFVKEAMSQALPPIAQADKAPSFNLAPPDAAPFTPGYVPLNKAHAEALHFPAPPDEALTQAHAPIGAQAHAFGAQAHAFIGAQAPAFGAQAHASIGAQANASFGAQAHAPIGAQANAFGAQANAPERQSDAPESAPPGAAASLEAGLEAIEPDGESLSEPPSDNSDVQQSAKAMLDAGEDAAAISRKLNISRTETSLLLKSLILTKAKEQADDLRSLALEALASGESAAVVARRFDLSHTEVALLAASTALGAEKMRGI